MTVALAESWWSVVALLGGGRCCAAVSSGAVGGSCCCDVAVSCVVVGISVESSCQSLLRYYVQLE